MVTKDAPARADSEVDRFPRPPPPPAVPPRSPYAQPQPGLLARALLGYRVIKAE